MQCYVEHVRDFIFWKFFYEPRGRYSVVTNDENNNSIARIFSAILV